MTGAGAGAPPARTGRPPGTWQSITSLTVGSVALLLSWVPVVNLVGALAALVAVVLGVVAMVRSSRGGGPAMGMAIGGTIVSVLAVITSVVILVAVYSLVSEVPRSFAGDPGYESSTDADGRATGPIAEDVDVTSCDPLVGEDSLMVSVTARNSRIAPSDYVVLVHVRDDRGRLVGEAMDSIRSVDPREEKLEIFEVVTNGPAAQCVVAKVVRL